MDYCFYLNLFWYKRFKNKIMKKLTLKTLFLLILLIKCELVLSQVCAAGSCSSSLRGTLSSGTYSNTAYCVSGNLTIDGVVSFTGCTLYMQNGANITVNSNKKLTFNNTHVLSCDQTNVWAGIHLWNGSNLGSYPRSLEIVNGSIMEDADILIWNASSNGILIENSFLNKNNTAIYFDGANTSTSTLEMYGTQITCYATSNNPSTRGPYVLAPYNDESTFGIFGSESGSKIIGDGSKNTNLFDNLTTAIYGYNMNLQIQNNSFDYCGFTNTSNSSYPYVISVENAGSVNNLLIGGASPSDGNSFSNSQYWGINVLNRTNTIIQNNYFNEVEKPIKIQNIQSSGNIAFPISIPLMIIKKLVMSLQIIIIHLVFVRLAWLFCSC